MGFSLVGRLDLSPETEAALRKLGSRIGFEDFMRTNGPTQNKTVGSDIQSMGLKLHPPSCSRPRGGQDQLAPALGRGRCSVHRGRDGSRPGDCDLVANANRPIGKWQLDPNKVKLTSCGSSGLWTITPDIKLGLGLGFVGGHPCPHEDKCIHR